MTICAVKIYDDEIELAADSLMTAGALKDKTNKIHVINENLIFTHSGYTKDADLLEQFLDTRDDDIFNIKDERHLLNKMIEFVEYRSKFFDSKKIEGEFLFISNKKVYYFNDFFIKEIKDFYAIGYGSDFAMALLYKDFSATEAAITTCELCSQCEAPVETIFVKKNDD